MWKVQIIPRQPCTKTLVSSGNQNSPNTNLCEKGAEIEIEQGFFCSMFLNFENLYYALRDKYKPEVNFTPPPWLWGLLEII